MKAKFVKSVLFLAMLSMGGSLMAAEPKPGVAEQTWTVNFKDTDIVEVVKFVQEVTGKPFIVDQKVRGPFPCVISARAAALATTARTFLADRGEQRRYCQEWR